MLVQQKHKNFQKEILKSVFHQKKVKEKDLKSFLEDKNTINTNL